MGSITLANVSVVVTADLHNPTILHPSFLQSEGIVPDDWEVMEGLVCTPAFSQVAFSNGIAFRVEQTRLQVIDGKPKGDSTGSLVPELARKYVDKLPHVVFKAVGVNFAAFSECDDADEYMIGRFLKTGTWNDNELKPLSLQAHLTYPITGATLNLSLKPGRFQKQGEEEARAGIVLEGNCHYDTPSIEEVRDAIKGFGQKLEEACGVCARILDANGDD